jgi:hypothetical protein
MSEIEQIQDLKTIREIKTKYGLSPRRKIELEKKISEKITTPKQHLSKRLKGLEKEDEFLLILYLFADMEQITRLEQKQVVNKKKYTIPDFLIGVHVPKVMNKSGPSLCQRMFVEVKKCRENSSDFVITKSAYQKLRYYSDLYAPIPLYFAIKFDMPTIKQWFFVSGKTIEKLSQTTKRKVNNKMEECHVIDVANLAKYDLSGMWLNNYQCLLTNGTKVTKTYDSSIKKPKILEKKLGALISHKIELKDKNFEIKINEVDFIEAMLYSSILKILSQGKVKRTKTEVITTIQYICDNNYFIPYYHILLDVYLHIRRQFKSIRNETDDSPEFYINNFEDFDRSIVNGIKNCFFKLVDLGFILPIRMMPNFDGEDKQH